MSDESLVQKIASAIDAAITEARIEHINLKVVDVDEDKNLGYVLKRYEGSISLIELKRILVP